MNDVFAEAGAIPYRFTGKILEILLISTSSGKNMTIPKGLIDPGFSAAETAANEAYEEAGIKGFLIQPSMGRYGFKKWGGRCEVKVFAMAVTQELAHWPEENVRRRVWKDFETAAKRVKSAELGELIRKLPGRVNHGAKAKMIAVESR